MPKPYPLSDHYNGTVFNSIPPFDFPSFGSIAKLLVSGASSKDFPKEMQEPPVKYEPIRELKEDEISITLIGHASCLIQTPKYNILTDPVYADRVGPYGMVGPKRAVKPAIAFDELPRIDYVVISHDHYDHLDVDTIAKLAKKFDPVFLAPLGNEDIIRSCGTEKVHELDWYESRKFTDDLEIITVPARHQSGRTPWGRNKTLWGGFIINAGPHRVFFAGDTGYGNHFNEIREKIGAPTVSLIPIGAYRPRDFMGPFHMDPLDALNAHFDIDSGLSIAIHYAVFNLTQEGPAEPPAELKQHNISNFQVNLFGESKIFSLEQIKAQKIHRPTELPKANILPLPTPPSESSKCK